jgi:hypothetical protein
VLADGAAVWGWEVLDFLGLISAHFGAPFWVKFRTFLDVEFRTFLGGILRRFWIAMLGRLGLPSYRYAPL